MATQATQATSISHWKFYTDKYNPCTGTLFSVSALNHLLRECTMTHTCFSVRSRPISERLI